MADFESIDFDDSKLLTSLRNIKQAVDDIGLANEEVGDDIKKNFENIASGIGDAEKELADLQKTMKAHIDNQKKAKQGQDEFSKSTKELVGDVKILGVNLTQTVATLRAKAAAARGATTGLNTMTTASKAFGIALKVALGPIALLLTALAGLVSWFTRTEKGVNAVAKVMAGLGAVIDVLLDRLTKIGGAVVKLFEGDFKGAFNEAKGAVSGLTDEINKEVKAAVALEDQTQKLIKAKRALSVESAQSRLKIKELNLVVEDTTKSIKDRLAAAEEAGTIERDLLAKKLAAEKEELAILEAKKRLKDNELAADSEELAQARIQLANTEAESLELQTTLQNKKNGLLAEQQARIQAAVAAQKELRLELEGLVKDFAAAAAEAERNQLDPVARVQAEAEFAKSVVENQFKIIEEKAKAAKIEVDLTEEKATLILAIERDAEEKITKINRDEQAKRLQANKEYQELLLNDHTNVGLQRLELEKKRLAAQDKAINASFAAQTKARQDAIVKSGQETLSALEIIGKKIQKALGFGNDAEGTEQFQQFADAIGSAFNSMFAGITAGIENQISENAAWLEDIRDQQAALEENLELEKKRRDEGLAYNLSGKEEELAELKRMEEQALKEQEELKKKAAAAQLIQDAATQVSNLITATTGIIEGFASVPILGVALGIAAVGSMFAFVAAQKAKAKETASRNFEGGFLGDILGPTASTEDQPHRGRGTYIHPDIIANANEYLINGDSTLANMPHLDKVNAHKYDGVDLDRFLSQFSPEEISQGFSHRQGQIDGWTAVNTTKLIRSSIAGAMSGMSRDIVKAIQNQPQRVAVGPGQRIRTYMGDSVSDITPAS